MSADRDVLRAALCAEMKRVHGAELIEPWVVDHLWEPISRPEPCECCGRVIVAIEDHAAGKVIVHMGPVIRDPAGNLRVQFVRHPRPCRGGARVARGHRELEVV